MSDALIDFSRCKKRIACLQHSIKREAGILTELGRALSLPSVPVTVPDPKTPNTFEMRDYGAAPIKRFTVDLGTLSRHLQDLKEETSCRKELEDLISKTEHAHMIES